VFEHVVVGVRGEESGRDAIALGNELASAEGRLTLLHVYVVPSKPAPDSGAVGDAAKRRYVLERLTAMATEFGVDAQETWVEARSVRRGLHGFAVGEHADLLVVGASHQDELARDLIGDDSRVLLEDAPCVVAIAPIGYAERVGQVRRIGVAYDGSEESQRALALARKLAAERHALLSAFEAVGALVDRDPWDTAAEFEEPVERARRRIAALGNLEAEAGFGEAVEELSRYGESVDLLVVGSHRYRPIERGLESSTSQRLADEVSCPLLVVPSAA
jgi:nucleotide-binding universal stress UspA family protein